MKKLPLSARLSHLIVVLVVASIILGRAFEPALLMGGADDALAEVFEQMLLYSLLAAGVVATVAAALASLLVSRRLVEPLRYVLASYQPHRVRALPGARVRQPQRRPPGQPDA